MGVILDVVGVAALVVLVGTALMQKLQPRQPPWWQWTEANSNEHQSKHCGADELVIAPADVVTDAHHSHLWQEHCLQ